MCPISAPFCEKGAAGNGIFKFMNEDPCRADYAAKDQKEVLLEMAEIKYEAPFVFSVKNGDEAVNALKEKFQSMIEANATLESVDDWGKRKLAYLIDYETEGYYVFFNFTSGPDFPAELERVANITDGVLRELVIKRN